MAKTKAGVDQNAKRQEIVTVAKRLFTEAGYEATSMSRLAEHVGVAPNTIYWYFADKDALLVAVLDRMVAEALREFERPKKAALDDQLLWLLSVLDGAESLIVTVHARVPTSEALRTTRRSTLTAANSWHSALVHSPEAQRLAITP